MKSDSLPTPYSDGDDEINRLISMIECDEPLAGLPPRLLQLWEKRNSVPTVHSAGINGHSTRGLAAMAAGYAYLDVTNEDSFSGGTTASALTDSSTPENMSLSALADRSRLEMSKFRRNEPSNDQYCLEIFRRATMQHDERAWDIIYVLFQDQVRQWFRNDATRTAALRHEDERTYVDDTFKRFWQSVNTQKHEFPVLASALRYLRLCLNSVIIDTLRAYTRKEVLGLPEPGSPNELLVEDTYHEHEWWSVIEKLLTNERERRVIYLLYHCGLKPREIVMRCPDEFTTEQEIYRLRRNGLERLKRHQEILVHRLGWKLSGDKEQKPEIGSIQTAQKEACLIVLSTGQAIPLRGELMVVGRQDPTLGIFPEINLADKTVGRRHAYLHNKQGTYTVEDLNALNKTRLNGVTLTPHEEHMLKDGDVLRFGSVEVRFELR